VGHPETVQGRLGAYNLAGLTVTIRSTFQTGDARTNAEF
jgi:hypothetical protein